MDRYCISAERINRQNVKILLKDALPAFVFQGEAGISLNHFDSRRRIAQEAEISPVIGNANDVRIDFIEAKSVTRLAIGGNSANPEPDNSDPEH